MANTFVKGDRVKTAQGTRTDGKVLIIACKLATAAGGKTCDPKLCPHPLKDKDMVWVLWSGMTKSYSYHYTELEYDTSPIASDDKADVKDDYIEKAKVAIKDAIKPKEPELDKDFWRLYGGFDKVKLDRNGRPFLYAVKVDECAPLKNEEIDWKKYHGFIRSKTYRKIAE